MHTTPRFISCLVNVRGAQIYCESAGKGKPFVMIHAGVADSRQWNNEFAHFCRTHKAMRYDMRGYGKSEPIEGEYNNLADLLAVLGALDIQESAIFMGCSMGGQLALDLALEHPNRVRALVMVGSAPSGLPLDVPDSPKAAEAEKAWKAGDLDLTAEIETQIWFDGAGRTPEQANPTMRKLLYEMDRLALSHEAKKLGKRLPNLKKPAAERLAELKVPLLMVVGEHDMPYPHAATDHMQQHVPSARKVVMRDAAHLPNMDHPEEFRRIVEDFLTGLPA